MIGELVLVLLAAVAGGLAAVEFLQELAWRSALRQLEYECDIEADQNDTD